MRIVVGALLGAALVAVPWAFAAGATEAGTASPRCAQLGGWQRLANRIDTAVYCPSWMPDPLVPQIGNHWNNIDSVDPDRSYLQSFAWREAAGLNTQEIHVNLRGYPGKVRIPRTCQSVSTVNGKTFRKKIPCFQDERGAWRSTNGLMVKMYTVNHGADSWHVLFAWRYGGSLYTISEHVAPPLSFSKVVANLKRMTNGLVLVPPR
ncbi:MAG: hypothetical protein WCJ67_02310 [Thermoleophilia bacterium]